MLCINMCKQTFPSAQPRTMGPAVGQETQVRVRCINMFKQNFTFPSAQPRTMGPAVGQEMQVTALVWINLLQIT